MEEEAWLAVDALAETQAAVAVAGLVMGSAAAEERAQGARGR